MPAARSVLVVDDDCDIQALLADRLTKAGFEVRTASNGAEAIEALESEEPPSAIVTDLMMPGVVGQELLEYVKHAEHLRGIPVAVVSGHPELAPPGFQVFRKPVRLRPILDYIEGALGIPVSED